MNIRNFFKRNIKYIVGAWLILAVVGTIFLGIDFLFLAIGLLILVLGIRLTIMAILPIKSSSRRLKWFSIPLRLIVGSAFVTAILFLTANSFDASEKLQILPIFIWLASLIFFSTLMEFYIFHFVWNFSKFKIWLILFTKNFTIYLLSILVLIGMFYLESLNYLEDSREIFSILEAL